jgi:toxin ParE1/3/4
MSFSIELTSRSIRDLERLEEWMAERNLEAAERLRDVLTQAIASLASHPRRSHRIDEEVYELHVPFGAGAYVVRYFVVGHRVYIARVWHGLEQR